MHLLYYEVDYNRTVYRLIHAHIIITMNVYFSPLNICFQTNHFIRRGPRNL